MILLGCLLAFSAAVAPRLILILAWIFSDRWPIVWGDNFLWPLLGIIFLPYTTIMYLLAWTPAVGGGANIEGWDWLWIIMGLFLDIMKWGQMLANRKEAQTQTMKYYPSGAPRYGGGSGTTSAAVSSGQVPPSTSPTAADHDTARTAAAAAPPAPEDDAPKT
jgi:hypothetical protein